MLLKIIYLVIACRYSKFMSSSVFSSFNNSQSFCFYSTIWKYRSTNN